MKEDNPPWAVQAHPFEFRVSDYRDHTKGCSTAGGLGCLSMLMVGIAMWILMTQSPNLRAMPWDARVLVFVAASGALLLILSLVTYYFRVSAKHKKDAITATTEARVRYTDIGVQVAGIGQSLGHAQFYLDVAEREFGKHRYAPFWDAMEAAASAIGQCHACQGYLAFDIDQYVNVLAGRLHNFPGWDHAVTSIPEARPVLNRFADLKDRAEADYQFASMREFRETRQVMIAGFRTLGEALRHLETAVVTSIADLRRAVDRSVLLRAADPAHLHVVARYLLGGGNAPTDKN